MGLRNDILFRYRVKNNLPDKKQPTFSFCAQIFNKD